MSLEDDERIGRLLRAIRRRRGTTQSALAQAVGIPRRDLMLIEAGCAGDVRLDRVRRAFSGVDARAKLTVWWNGAVADRLLDERHAALVERAVALFKRRGWQAAVEVTFAEWGERGSIDVFAGYPALRAVAVCEVKSALGSLEETNRMLDVKVRLAPKLALATFRWRPTSVSRLLIVPADDSIRRVVARHAVTMESVYPARSREVRAWIHRPEQPIGGLWFLSEVRNTDTISP